MGETRATYSDSGRLSGALETQMTEAEVDGFVEPGFETVRDAFEANFRAGEEIGATCAVVVGNELVVDLWGGMANPKTGQAWREDTLVNMFSTTKGLSALAVAHAHARGLFDYNENVATYWPEFAANGKDKLQAVARLQLRLFAGVWHTRRRWLDGLRRSRAANGLLLCHEPNGLPSRRRSSRGPDPQRRP